MSYVKRIIFICYGRDVQALDLHHIFGTSDDERMLFRAILPDITAWSVRLYRNEMLIHESFSGCGVNNIRDFLESRAMTLIHLDHLGYSCPKMIMTVLGEPIGYLDGWHVWVTSYFEGDVIQPTTKQLCPLGESSGRLNSLHAGNACTTLIGRANLHPKEAIPMVLAQFML